MTSCTLSGKTARNILATSPGLLKAKKEKFMINAPSTKRDCTDDLLDDTDERRQPGNVLDELIAERLRTIIDQTNLHVQQAERFNQLISKYEERIGHIEEKQAAIVGNLQKSNQGIASLVERIELIEMQSKAWDLNGNKAAVAEAKLVVHVQEVCTEQFTLFDERETMRGKTGV